MHPLQQESERATGCIEVVLTPQPTQFFLLKMYWRNRFFQVVKGVAITKLLFFPRCLESNKQVEEEDEMEMEIDIEIEVSYN